MNCIAIQEWQPGPLAPKSLFGEVYPDIVKVYLKTISPIKNIANPLISVIKTLGKKRGGMGWSITWSSKVLASNLSLQVSSLSKFLWKLKSFEDTGGSGFPPCTLFLGYSCIIVFLVCLSLHLCSWFQVACFSIQFVVFIKFYYHEITILLIL